MKDYANVGSKEQDSLQKINIAIDANTEIGSAEQAARNALGHSDDSTVLVAWWDGTRKTGGPQEACRGDQLKCSQDYAKSHGASTKVEVNDGQYEFFYGEVPAGHEGQMRDLAIDLRKGLESFETTGIGGG